MIATLQSMAESHAIYRAPISIWVHLILSFVVAFIHSLVFGTKISRCLIASRRTWIAGAIISTAPTLVPSTGSAPTEGRLTLYSINAWICRKLSARKTGAITSGKRRFLADGRHQGSPPRVAPPDVMDAV